MTELCVITKVLHLFILQIQRFAEFGLFHRLSWPNWDTRGWEDGQDSLRYVPTTSRIKVVEERVFEQQWHWLGRGLYGSRWNLISYGVKEKDSIYHCEELYDYRNM